MQIDIVNVEAYHYDGDCIVKAADMGFPGLVDIRQRQARAAAPAVYVSAEGLAFHWVTCVQGGSFVLCCLNVVLWRCW